MRIYAPVLICTLNRHEHFKRCVESLLRCTGVEETDLYIAFDYPLKEVHWEGYNKIDQYISEIKGFKSVIVIKREENYGIDKNFFSARKAIFEKYDRIIILEDDNEFSPNFLDYINKGLDKFENNANVYAICGYNYPIKMPAAYKSNYYLMKLLSGWGYGVWKYKYWELPENTNYLFESINHIKAAIKLDRAWRFLLPGLLYMIRTKRIFGDVLITQHLVQQNMYCVFPYITKVRNHGHDGTGENCGVVSSGIYCNQDIDENDTFFYTEMEEEMYDNKGIATVLSNFFKRSLLKRAYTYFMYILFILKRNGNKQGPTIVC